MAKVGGLTNIKNTIKAISPFIDSSKGLIPANQKQKSNNSIGKIVAGNVIGINRTKKTAPKIDLFA